MKIQANQCKSITEIRDEIDRIDKNIVALLGERFQYIKEIVRFKTNADDVNAKQRYLEVIQARRQWASEEGINADVVEKLYIDLIQHFIEEQMKMLQIQHESL